MNDWNEKEGAVSEWNEAMFKMRRLDLIQQEINVCKMNPLTRHPVTNEWNYVMWFNAVNNLYGEGESKYKPDEKVTIKKLKDLIETRLDLFPPHQLINIRNISGNVQQHSVNKENWKVLKRLIEMMESEVKLCNDKHGLSTKNAENMSGYSILR